MSVCDKIDLKLEATPSTSTGNITLLAGEEKLILYLSGNVKTESSCLELLRLIDSVSFTIPYRSIYEEKFTEIKGAKVHIPNEIASWRKVP